MKDPLCHLIRNRLAEVRRQRPKGVLIMAHLVLGYPSLEENHRVMAEMVNHGVDLIELQIPFSEPIADGPIIARANHISLSCGFRVQQGLDAILAMTQQHSVPILIMTYANILEAYGSASFINESARVGAYGLIVPDLPVEESSMARNHCHSLGMSWISILTPTSSDERLREIAAHAHGFCYCVARKGVTGKQTEFSRSIEGFISRCRRVTELPLAVGFGIKRVEDVRHLEGIADIAIIGTAAIEIQERAGTPAVGRFFAELSANIPSPLSKKGEGGW